MRYKLTLAALAVEAVMFAFLIWNGMRVGQDALQQQAEQRLKEIAGTLAVALQAPLSQQDDASVRDIVETLRQGSSLEYIEVRDSAGRPIHQTGEARRKNDFELIQPIELAGQRYGEATLVLSGTFIVQASRQYVRDSFVIAIAALILTGLLLAFSTGGVIRRFESLTRASKRMAQGDLDVLIEPAGEDEIGQLVGTFNRMAESVRFNVQRARENEARFHAIADYTHDIEFWLSPEGRLLWVNPSVERMLGHSVGTCMGKMNFPIDVIHPEDRAAAEFQLRQALRGTSGEGYTLRLVRNDGSHFWGSVNWQPIHDYNGIYQGIRASIYSIDDLKATEANLRETLAELRAAETLQRKYLDETEQERARLVSLLSAMNLGILFVGTDSRVIYHNPNFTRMWMIDERVPLIGLRVHDVLAKSASTLARPDHFSKHLLSVLETREVSDSFEIQMTDGRVITELDYPVRDGEGRFIGHLWIYEDVTRERQTAEQLVYLAERDALTGLYNRHRFQQELGRTMLESDRHQMRSAVMFFDLDEFKTINDTYGHRAGDALLIRVAGEIGALVRRNEVLARLGGDEFAILLPNVQDKEAEALAERVVRAIAQIPFRFEGQNLRLTTSLGIAYYPTHAADADDLVARADIAMYQAKSAGKNTWRVFRADESADSEMRSRLSWSERISNAIDKNLFQLHFQGVYQASDSTLSHLEALIRMIDERDPGQLIMPGHFIPLAEKSGRILDIDRWVIREVVRRLSENSAMPAIAVNLSGRSLSEPDLPQFIGDELRAAHVDPRRLIVEITETAAVSDLHDAQRMIEALHQLGCGVYLDDFGVGFASFAYLKHLNVDTIKIDGIFIRDLPSDPDNQVFVQAMVSVALGLGKSVLAEYVEDGKTLALLRTYGIDLVQGYFLDRPVADHPALSPVAVPVTR
ncbi:MAG: sensor domain-containing diguanylate cyclase [Hydrogenophilales bacterium 16-64-46]|nr:MAG: sensor domain-containing diguanylate cyclase [Hydrogenophilales bacterium 12-64-13]OYZ06906.1 MAG: sensor domain-containing diguanylate cyclase [Hydrogenophilales bacterium 16-64-46]OZA39566.1 MAG: sensor domain-containing diguanylate cyclase [Hydrogenophilales bacterium 17-64-34]